MKKETFAILMNAIKMHIKGSDEVSETFRNSLQNTSRFKTNDMDFIDIYGLVYDGQFVESVINSLKTEFGISENNSSNVFDCFIYDLDFGNNWETGDITDKDGNDIKLQTNEDLYDYLVKTYITSKD